VKALWLLGSGSPRTFVGDGLLFASEVHFEKWANQLLKKKLQIRKIWKIDPIIFCPYSNILHWKMTLSTLYGDRNTDAF
jgi:hypothetical protein